MLKKKEAKRLNEMTPEFKPTLCKASEKILETKQAHEM